MRVTRILVHGLLLSLALVAAIGCGRSGSAVRAGGAGTAGDSSGATALVADALAASMQSGDTLFHGPCMGPGLPLRIPTGCPYDVGSGAFTCGPEIDHHGFTVTRSYQFLDAANAPQAAYDTLTTATIRFVSSVSGTSTDSMRYRQVDDHRELSESGLLGAEAIRIWNGAGTSSHRDSVRAPDGTRRLRSSTASTSVNAVIVPAPFGRTAWPLSGSITTHLVNSDGADLTSVLTFNGTQYASLTIGDSTYAVDLASGAGIGRGPGHGRGPGGGPGHH